MRRITTMFLAALLVAGLSTVAAANSAPPDEECWGDVQPCDTCGYGSYTGVCIDIDGCWEAGDDDSADSECSLQCVTNADHPDLEQCPDVELPSCECSAGGAAGTSSALGALLLLTTALLRRARRTG